jgi:hypothetical protein
MKTAIRLLLLALAVVASLASAAYTYYFTDTMASYQPTYWTENGSFSFTTVGGYPTQIGSGDFISKVSVPDGTSSYEVKETLHNSVSGSTEFALLLRASSNATNPFQDIGTTSTGTFYAGHF